MDNHSVREVEYRECPSCRRRAAVPVVAAGESRAALVCMSCHAPGVFTMDDPKEDLDADRQARLRYEVRYTPCPCGGIMSSPGFGSVCVYCSTPGTTVVKREPIEEFEKRTGKKLRLLRGRLGV